MTEFTLRRLLQLVRRPLLYLMAVAYIGAGLMHFVVPELYAQIIPPFLPWPVGLVYLSGVAEVAVGIGLLVPQTRRLAAWATIALLLAIFPANIYMATSGVVIEGSSGVVADPSPLVRWSRLPVQGVLIAWAWWYTRPPADVAG